LAKIAVLFLSGFKQDCSRKLALLFCGQFRKNRLKTVFEKMVNGRVYFFGF
jgi:hypothetical protein